MKIAVLGATGRSGKCLVNDALNRGFHVTALVRNPSKLSEIQHENLSVIEVDIFNSAILSSEFTKVDAVLSCLGASLKFRGIETLYSTSIKAMTNAMKAANITRLICITSGLQVIKPEDEVPWLSKFMANVLVRKALDDMIRMEKHLFDECSDLDFTIVRPTGLLNGSLDEREPVAIADVHYNQDDSHRIPRANVAKFMLDALAENKWNKTAVYISMPK